MTTPTEAVIERMHDLLTSAIAAFAAGNHDGLIPADTLILSMPADECRYVLQAMTGAAGTMAIVLGSMTDQDPLDLVHAMMTNLPR